MSNAIVNGLAGACGGIVAQIITYPLQTVNTRQQTERVAKDSQPTGRGSGTGSSLVHILEVIKSEGLGGLFSGLKPSLLGTAASQAFTNKAVAIAVANKTKGTGDGSPGMLSWLIVAALAGWGRLENLLVQGRKDRDFNAKDALQPVLKLLLGPDGEQLRNLVIKEAVRVTEAIILGSVIESYNSVPDFLRTFFLNINATGPFVMNSAERESMLELRAQVFRIWELLQSSDNFDPSILQPILQVLQEPEARHLGGRVVGGITQRLAARLLQQVLRDPPAVSSPAS